MAEYTLNTRAGTEKDRDLLGAENDNPIQNGTHKSKTEGSSDSRVKQPSHFNGDHLEGIKNVLSPISDVHNSVRRDCNRSEPQNGYLNRGCDTNGIEGSFDVKDGQINGRIMCNEQKESENEGNKQIAECGRETSKIGIEEKVQEPRCSLQEMTSKYDRLMEQRFLEKKQHEIETASLKANLKQCENEKREIEEEMTKTRQRYIRENEQQSTRIKQLNSSLTESKKRDTEYEKQIEEMNREIQKVLLDPTAAEQYLLTRVSELTGKLKEKMEEKKLLKERLEESERALEDATLEMKYLKEVSKDRIEKLEQTVTQKEKEKLETQQKSETVILKLIHENKRMDDNLKDIHEHIRRERIDSDNTKEEIQKMFEERETLIADVQELTKNFQTLKADRDRMEIVIQTSISAFEETLQMKDRQIRELQEIIDKNGK